MRTVVNGGVRHPRRSRWSADRQNDVITYGLSLARALTQAAEVVGEVNGRCDTRGDEPARPSNDPRRRPPRGPLHRRAAGAATRALIIGLTGRDPGIGFAAGFTYVFNAFQVP